MRTLLLGLSALLMNAEAQTDDAVIAVMKKADAEMVHVKVLKRSVVGVVIAIGSPKNLALGDGRWVPWTEKQKMGVFFVDQGGVYPLAIRPGSPGCVIRVERITSTEGGGCLHQGWCAIDADESRFLLRSSGEEIDRGEGVFAVRDGSRIYGCGRGGFRGEEFGPADRDGVSGG